MACVRVLHWGVGQSPAARQAVLSCGRGTLEQEAEQTVGIADSERLEPTMDKDDVGMPAASSAQVK